MSELVSERDLAGMGSPKRVTENMDLLAHKIPSGLWAELRSERLIRQDAPLP